MEIIIDGKKVSFESGETILEIARRSGIDIPSLCHHSDLEAQASCRICLVGIKGKKGLYTSCSTKAEDKMEVITNSPSIEKARKTNLELIFSQHCEECYDCVWNYKCDLLELAKKFKANKAKYSDRKKNYPVYRFGPKSGPALIFDSSKCIDCGNCVLMCKNQAVNFLEIREKQGLFEVFPSNQKNRDCVYCGQCIIHCPAGAFEAVGEFENIKSEPYRQKGKMLVFQFAPSIRTSIGEEFGLPYGSVLTGQLAGALKKIGVDKVFDVSVGADFTTIEEAKELLERIKENKKMPLFTSCCPAWVKFVEFYHPELIPNLTTVRSPQMISAKLIKTYWAKKQGINPKDIILVSVMPCISKKYEIKRKENKGLIDYVLTTRELARVFMKHKIDLKNIKEEELDCCFSHPSGAGVIYGASGGVMESALRTAAYKLTGKKMDKIEFKDVRGLDGIKKAEVEIAGKKIKIAVANGLGNAKKIIEELKQNPKAYDYAEVMACPGGCIGGGGQPMPTSQKIRKERAESLYKIDKGKDYRLADLNPEVIDVYSNFLKTEKIIHKICHTKFSKKKKESSF